MSKFSLDSSTHSDHTNSVKWDFTFQSHSGTEMGYIEKISEDNKQESDSVDPVLLKFLTNTSETTSLQFVNEENPPSLVPVISEFMLNRERK